MATMRELKAKILNRGVDAHIDENDVQEIRDHILKDGEINHEDLEVLIELRRDACSVCQAFNDLLFPALKKEILADGELSLMDQFYLLRILYGGFGVDEADRKFLREIKRELKTVPPEFKALYDLAMKS